MRKLIAPGQIGCMRFAVLVTETPGQLPVYHSSHETMREARAEADDVARDAEDVYVIEIHLQTGLRRA